VVSQVSCPLNSTHCAKGSLYKLHMAYNISKMKEEVGFNVQNNLIKPYMSKTSVTAPSHTQSDNLTNQDSSSCFKLAFLCHSEVLKGITWRDHDTYDAKIIKPVKSCKKQKVQHRQMLLRKAEGKGG
jgi:hypothetical protein